MQTIGFSGDQKTTANALSGKINRLCKEMHLERGGNKATVFHTTIATRADTDGAGDITVSISGADRFHSDIAPKDSIDIFVKKISEKLQLEQLGNTFTIDMASLDAAVSELDGQNSSAKPKSTKSRK